MVYLQKIDILFTANIFQNIWVVSYFAKRIQINYKLTDKISSSCYISYTFKFAWENCPKVLITTNEIKAFLLIRG